MIYARMKNVFQRHIQPSRKVTLDKKWMAQAAQDVFAMVVAEKTGNTSYLEIGAKHPYVYSNTKVLERREWTGTSIEIRKSWRPDWEKSERDQSRVKWVDALTFDYSALPEKMGFLSCDIDPPWDVNIRALKRVIETGPTFDSICYEHNAYLQQGTQMKRVKVTDSIEDRRGQQDAILIPAGYKRVVKDACAYYDPDMPFEDWWVHESIDFPEMTFKEFCETYKSLILETFEYK